MYYERFLLGPLGYMQSLYSPFARQGVNASVVRSGNARQAASGQASLVIFGYKREWQFSYPLITPDQAAILRAFWKWTQPRVLRFVDPFVINLASSDASGGGSESRTSDAFTAITGTKERVDILTGHPSFLDSAIKWTIPSSTVGTLLVDNVTSKRIVLRDTRPLVFAWEATGAGTVQSFVRPYNLAGVAQTDVLGSAVVLDATWKTASVSYTPSAGHVSCIGGLLKQSAGSQQILHTTGLLFRDSADSSVWSIGEGIGEVYIKDFRTQYKNHGKYSADFIVGER